MSWRTADPARRGIALAVSVALPGCGVEPPAPAAPAAPAAPPDILLVVLDTTRADAVSGAGDREAVTPQVSAIAAAGVTFTDVTAPASWTWPSHGSLFTGLPPWEHGARTRSNASVTDGRRVAQVWPLRDDVPTLAEHLGRAGYQTTALSQNQWLSAELGLTRGFDHVEVLSNCPAVEASLDQALRHSAGQPTMVFINLLEAHAPWSVSPSPRAEAHRHRLVHEPGWLAPFVTAEPLALDLYRPAHADGPSGFQAIMRGDLRPTTADRALIRDLYQADVSLADYCLNRVLTTWQRHRPLGIVAVTSDHGEYLGEHGLLEHGQTVWPQVTDVPLVLVGPGLPAGSTVDVPVQLQDVPGTLLALAGLEASGSTVLPAVRGEPRSVPIQAAAWHHPEPAGAIGGRFLHDWFWYREGMWAVAFSPTSTSHLYDLSVDRGAQQDVAEQHPERHAALMARARGAFPVATNTGQVELSAEVEEQLRAIGYVGSDSLEKTADP